MDIQETTVTIRIWSAPGAPEAERAEARGIVESIRIEPQDNKRGFEILGGRAGSLTLRTAWG